MSCPVNQFLEGLKDEILGVSCSIRVYISRDVWRPDGQALDGQHPMPGQEPFLQPGHNF